MANGDNIGGLVPAPSTAAEWDAWQAQRTATLAPLHSQQAALTAEMSRLEAASMLPGADVDGLYNQYQIAENQRSILDINNNTTFPPHISDSGQFEPGDFQSFLHERVGGEAAWNSLTPDEQRAMIQHLGPEYMNMRQQEAARRGATQRLGPVLGELFVGLAGGGVFGRCRTCGVTPAARPAPAPAARPVVGERVPIPEAGTPERTALTQQIHAVNQGPIPPGMTRTHNCPNCVIATDATLAGRPASALAGRPTDMGTLESAFGRTFRGPGTVDQIRSHMAGAGDGARGVVAGFHAGPAGTGHVLNVVNNRGSVVFVDGQSGYIGPQFPGQSAYRPNDFMLMRTD